MRYSEYENNINSKLCDLLKRSNLPAQKEKKLGRHGRADIFVEFDDYSVAVECEQAGSSKRKQAENDAMSRLVPYPHASAAFAVVYPLNCTEASLDYDTIVDVSYMDKTYAIKKSRQHRLGDDAVMNISGVVQRPLWQKRKVKELVALIRNSNKDVGDPDLLAQDLRETLERAVKYLPQPQVRTLGKSLDLVPIQKDDWNPAASRALLVVATAAMFQRRLDQYLPEMKPKTDMRTGLPFKGSWPPPLYLNAMMHPIQFSLSQSRGI